MTHDCKTNPLPPIAEVQDKFIYEPETGVLRWRWGGGGTRAGDIAGTIKQDGYVYIGGKTRFMAHRLIWLLITGQEPVEDIDHINGNRSDNRLTNLREVSRSVNLQNRKACDLGNRSGFLGVTKIKQSSKCTASIKADGRVKYLGVFLTPEAAHEAYLQAKRKLHPGNTL